MVAAFISNFLGKDLKDDPVYQERLAKGLIKMRGATKLEVKPGAKLSVAIFLFAFLAVVTYATMISGKVGLIKNPVVTRDAAIMLFMLTAATFISFFSKIDTAQVLNSSTFKSGMSACICVLGVAWLGDTFVANHINEIKAYAGDLLNVYPWLLAVVLFFASTLLYSQAATTKALIPSALLLGVSPLTVVASFAAVSALFVLPPPIHHPRCSCYRTFCCVCLYYWWYDFINMPYAIKSFLRLDSFTCKNFWCYNAP